MSIRLSPIAVLMATSILAGCSAGPVSQATTLSATNGPSDASPSAAAVPSDAAVPPTPPSGSPASTAAPTGGAAASAPAPGDVPPRPGKPTFRLVKETPGSGGVTTEYEITWTSPSGAASEFVVYGVTKCLRYAKKYDGKPCLVRGMPIPRSALKLLGRAPGDARSMRVSWDQGEAGPGPYASILLRASNSIGDSIFTIVQSEDVCYRCTY